MRLRPPGLLVGSTGNLPTHGNTEYVFTAEFEPAAEPRKSWFQIPELNPRPASSGPLGGWLSRSSPDSQVWIVFHHICKAPEVILRHETCSNANNWSDSMPCCVRGGRSLCRYSSRPVSLQPLGLQHPIGFHVAWIPLQGQTKTLGLSHSAAVSWSEGAIWLNSSPGRRLR